jgi:hypothetical protein
MQCNATILYKAGEKKLVSMNSLLENRKLAAVWKGEAAAVLTAANCM